MEILEEETARKTTVTHKEEGWILRSSNCSETLGGFWSIAFVKRSEKKKMACVLRAEREYIRVVEAGDIRKDTAIDEKDVFISGFAVAFDVSDVRAWIYKHFLFRIFLDSGHIKLLGVLTEKYRY